MDDPTTGVADAAPVSPRVTFGQVKRHLPPHLALAGRLAGGGAVEVAGDGCWVRLSDGRRALDFGSYAVTLLGHRHPDVVGAVHRQLDAMPTATRLLVNPVTAAAAAAVVDYLGGGLPRVYFGSDGADAVEAAVKLARLASGRNRIVAVEGGFHGKSLGALALTHHERFRAGSHEVLPPVAHVSPEDPEALTRELAMGDVAAVVFEPVQGENGVRPIDAEVLRAWCAAAAAQGVFVVADEIQTGLRRCGERALAVTAGLPVDAVLLGKPLGGGVLPLSAAVCSERLYAPLIADPTIHTATFAGHPLACAALPAALAAIEAAADQGRAVAAALASGLERIHRDHPDIVRDVRGAGLLWGLDLASADLTGSLVVRLAQAGLLVSPCMSQPATLRLLPPIVASAVEVEQALDILSSAVSALSTTDNRAPAAVPARAEV